MLNFDGLNYWAVLVAALVNMGVGSYWYSPAGFGKMWSKATGLDMMKMDKGEANKGIGFMALGAVVQSYLLAVLVHSLGATTWTQGFWIGALVWAAFVAATTLGDTIYARRGWNLWSINVSYFLVVLVINSIILSLWHG